MSQTPPPATPPSQPLQYQPSQPTSGLAIASMVLGIIALVFSPCPCIWNWFISIPAGLIAVILGFIALGPIKRGEAGGRGMALTGLICGIIAIILAIVMVLLVVVLGVIGEGFGQWVEEELERQRQDGADPQSYLHGVRAVWYGVAGLFG